MKKKMESYEEFWPYYLEVHSRPWTKRFHVWGTLVAILTAVILAFNGLWFWVPFTLIIGYGSAWFSHFFIEKNIPATFQHFRWSFISDFRMIYCYLTGKI